MRARDHGWKVVGCAFLIAVFGWGFGFYGIGVFMAALVERHGWATSSVSFAVTALYLVGAAMIAFIDVIQLLGFVFLAVIPLVFIMKRPRTGGPSAGSDAAH